MIVMIVMKVIKKKSGCQTLYSNIKIIFLYYYKALFRILKKLNDNHDNHDNHDNL